MVGAIWVAVSALLGESRAIDVMPTFSHPTALHSTCLNSTVRQYFKAASRNMFTSMKRWFFRTSVIARTLGSNDERRLPLRIPSSSTAPFRSCYAGLKTLLSVIIMDRIPPALVSNLSGDVERRTIRPIYNLGTVFLARVNIQIGDGRALADNDALKA
ncbi:hypothetical protein C8J57DRAFT_1594694 [Mycena rebaudengoi]|nr:hypothetical protein C8J57DRAFT_1594694 [Mycena rebaudengoi]